jgi:hypothetical protein
MATGRRVTKLLIAYPESFYRMSLSNLSSCMINRFACPILVFGALVNASASAEGIKSHRFFETPKLESWKARNQIEAHASR